MAAPAADVTRFATAGSPADHTLRILALLSREPESAVAPTKLQTVSLTPVALAAWLNTGHANADRDGAVWQGRGVTASLTGGVLASSRFAELSIRPIAFATQNVAFNPATPNGGPASSGFNDPFWSGSIDLPYRFGPGAVGHVMPGESWARLGPRIANVGFSTASEQWGPAHIYPLVLGAEGPGFPRIFGELHDAPVRVGKVSARWIVGRLEGSPYSPMVKPGSRSRMITALTGDFAFGGPLDGLTVGASRFFHVRWSPANIKWTNVKLPLKGLLKINNPTNETESSSSDFNQIASVFMRVAPPGSGFEAYGELYREDHNVNFRDLVGEPDHQSAYTLGIRRAWRRDGGRVSAVTVENTNARVTHLIRVRGQAPIYIHATVSEGHTYLGQPLGSIAAFGGEGTIVTFDRIAQDASTSVEAEVRQTTQNVEGGTWSGQPVARVGLRLARTHHGGRLSRGWSVGVDQGMGLERGLNASLGFFLAAHVDSRPTDRVK